MILLAATKVTETCDHPAGATSWPATVIWVSLFVAVAACVIVKVWRS